MTTEKTTAHQLGLFTVPELPRFIYMNHDDLYTTIVQSLIKNANKTTHDLADAILEDIIKNETKFPLTR